MNDLGLGAALGGVGVALCGVIVLAIRVLAAYLRRRLDELEGPRPTPRRRRRRSFAEKVFIPARDHADRVARDTKPDE